MYVKVKNDLIILLLLPSLIGVYDVVEILYEFMYNAFFFQL